MNQRFFSSEERDWFFFGVVIELWFLIIGKKVFFLIFNSMMPKFLIFLPFFLLQSHFGFTCFFFFNFHFCCPSFFLTFLSQLLTVKNLLIVLGTWGDFLRWFRYLDFFFIPKRDNHDVFVLFSYDFESAEEKKRIGLIFFWLGEQKKFFEWFFSRNRWSKWPYDFHSVIFFVQV